MFYVRRKGGKKFHLVWGTGEKYRKKYYTIQDHKFYLPGRNVRFDLPVILLENEKVPDELMNKLESANQMHVPDKALEDIFDRWVKRNLPKDFDGTYPVEDWEAINYPTYLMEFGELPKDLLEELDDVQGENLLKKTVKKYIDGYVYNRQNRWNTNRGGFRF